MNDGYRGTGKKVDPSKIVLPKGSAVISPDRRLMDKLDKSTIDNNYSVYELIDLVHQLEYELEEANNIIDNQAYEIDELNGKIEDLEDEIAGLYKENDSLNEELSDLEYKIAEGIIYE